MSKSKTKLHEILAVEPSVSSTASIMVKEAINTFDKKETRFSGRRRTYLPRNDDGIEYPSEYAQVVETVKGKLNYLIKHLEKSADLSATKEETNTKARATLTIDGKDVGSFPPTVFLSLEKQFQEFKKVLLSIPTLDPTVVWTPDETRNDIYESAPVKTYKTEKIPQVLTLAEATKEHPAQTQVFNKDETIGTWTTINESGLIYPKDKSEMLDRVDKIIRAIKKARQRANDIEIEEVKMAKKLFNFVING